MLANEARPRSVGGRTVTIASGLSGRALKLESTAGQATALMQWSNYPGAIPVNSQGTITVRITGNFTTSISNTLQHRCIIGSRS